jgi:uncharacterized membrane protein YqaE (UPF0057 family)
MVLRWCFDEILGFMHLSEPESACRHSIARPGGGQSSAAVAALLTSRMKRASGAPHSHPLTSPFYQFRLVPERLRNMSKVILIILAILLPPLAVYLKTNSAKDTIINIVLCFFFWIPGILHALYLILK